MTAEINAHTPPRIGGIAMNELNRKLDNIEQRLKSIEDILEIALDLEPEDHDETVTFKGGFDVDKVSANVQRIGKRSFIDLGKGE